MIFFVDIVYQHPCNNLAFSVVRPLLTQLYSQ
jgi:hypothetical protein